VLSIREGTSKKYQMLKDENILKEAKEGKYCEGSKGGKSESGCKPNNK
jgi:hypothetical protein